MLARNSLFKRLASWTVRYCSSRVSFFCLQLGLEPLALGNVAADRRGADHRFGSVADRRQAQGNIERARVFSCADRLMSGDRLAAARFGEKRFQLGAARAIDQRGKRTADHIACAIAVKFFRAAVPGDDFTVERHAQDCVIGEFDDGGELGSIRLGLFRTEQNL